MKLATAYDLVNTVLFLPSGGSGRLRRSLVHALDVRRGHRVLELGCGTGLVTTQLLAAGAEVVAVDALPAMLVGARRRAPGATFVEGDALEVDVGGGYDRAVLSFVLHGLDVDDRIRLLRRTAAALAPAGRIGVLDWALPAGRVHGALWRRVLSALEPSAATTQQLLDGALDSDIPAAGLQIDERRRLAAGRAEILVVSASG
jgi:ubiquinone/menaquinone biosynthesis C-methylase UbiE